MCWGLHSLRGHAASLAKRVDLPVSLFGLPTRAARTAAALWAARRRRPPLMPLRRMACCRQGLDSFAEFATDVLCCGVVCSLQLISWSVALPHSSWWPCVSGFENFPCPAPAPCAAERYRARAAADRGPAASGAGRLAAFCALLTVGTGGVEMHQAIGHACCLLAPRSMLVLIFRLPERM